MNTENRFFRVWNLKTGQYEPIAAISTAGKIWTPKEVLQPENVRIEFCIGCKDKDGKLIYAGDIINFGWFAPENNFIVKWDQEMMRFVFCESRGDFPGTISSNDKLNEAKIIGNINEVTK